MLAQRILGALRCNRGETWLQKQNCSKLFGITEASSKLHSVISQSYHTSIFPSLLSASPPAGLSSHKQTPPLPCIYLSIYVTFYTYKMEKFQVVRDNLKIHRSYNSISVTISTHWTDPWYWSSPFSLPG